MQKNNVRGFTIVELLIVIVVIAILATISIVAYGGIQERAREAKISSAVDSYIKLLKMYKTEHGSYPSAEEGFICLGSTNMYPAKDGFAPGQCSDYSVDVNDEYVKAEINDALLQYANELPDISLPILNDGGSSRYRGIDYFSFNNNQTVYMNYVLPGERECPQGEASRYNGITWCFIEI